MKYVKFVCPYCDKAIKYKKYEYFLQICLNIITPILMAFGIVFLIYYYIVGPTIIMDNLIGGFYKIENKKVDSELRLIAMNITKDCSTDMSECFVEEMYKNISHIRYVPTSIYKQKYDPLYVYKYGGDCKNTANMFVALLESVGINGKIRCSIKESHCISEFINKDGNKQLEGKFVVDLTIPIAVYMNRSDDVWNYLEYEPIWE